MSITTETCRIVNKSIDVCILNLVLGLYFINFIGYFVRRYRAMKKYEWEEARQNAFVTSVPDQGGWSASPSGRLISGEKGSEDEDVRIYCVVFS